MEMANARLAGSNAAFLPDLFLGQLSYEIAVDAGQGQAFWERVMVAGN